MWQDEMTVILRHTINDVDDPQTYTDSRLQLGLVVGAQFVNTEFDFTQPYTVSVIGLNISPDPTSLPAPDNWFINLTVMKTSMMMLSNDLKLAAQQAWTIKDVDVTVDMKEAYKARKMILDELKEYYEWAGMQYRIGVRSAGQAILTPFNILAGGMRAPLYGFSDRDRMIW
jgi:hypothetical protein